MRDRFSSLLLISTDDLKSVMGVLVSTFDSFRFEED